MNYQYGGRFRPTGRPMGAPVATGAAPVSAPHPCPDNRLGVPPTEGCAVSSLAMVYAPTQAFRLLYDPAKALCRGTLFAELDKPFRGGGRC